MSNAGAMLLGVKHSYVVEAKHNDEHEDDNDEL